MSIRARRLAPLAFVALLVAALAPVATATDATTQAAIVAAEKGVLTLTNKRRVEHGLVSLRWDSRVAAIARERAQYMASTGVFSHTEKDGSNVFDDLSASDIVWNGGGEIIAWNTAGDLQYSAAFAVKQWMESSGHRAIVLSSGYNYVGFGMAISPTTGKRYWAGVYIKGPDRTGAWAKVDGVTKRNLDASSVKVTIDWSGNDTRLQVNTSGLRYYQAQGRRAGGSWTTYPLQTGSVITRTWGRARTYEFRVRARDRAGNWGSWETLTVRT